MSGQAAARLGDPVAHTAAMGGFETGGLLGFAVGVGIVAFVIGTGGTGLAVVAAVGGAVAATGGGALTGMNIGHTYTNTVGGIITGSPNVIVNGRKAARAIVDKADCSNHGPPQTIAQGSKIVFVNTDPAARKGDLVTCGAFIQDGSPNVYIGREAATYVSIAPEVPTWMVRTAAVMAIAGTAVALGAGAAAAFAAGGLCGAAAFGVESATAIGGSMLGSAAGGAIGQAMGGAKGQAWGEALGGLAGGAAGGAGGPSVAESTLEGHPVNVATGQMVTQFTDFALGGPLPLVFTRTWWSGSTIDGELGSGWHHSLDMAAIPLPSRERIAVRLADGRFAYFMPPAPDAPTLNTVERMQLWTDGRRLWATDYTATRFEFGPPLADGLRQLVQVVDPNGNALLLQRDAAGRLQRITDSTGRTIGVRRDKAGRLLGLDGPAPAGAGTAPLVSFSYGDGGLLAQAADATGAAFAYSYDNRLMVEERRPAGVRFHFRWDDPARGRAARCVETWGDPVRPGGPRLYGRCLRYDAVGRVTVVTDDAGRETRHDWDDRGLVVATVDSLGGRTVILRDEAGRMNAQVLPGGATVSRSYDQFGRLQAWQQADGAVTRLTYPDPAPGAVVTATALTIAPPGGGLAQRRYDDRHNLVVATDASGWQARAVRDARGLLLAIQDGLGVVARYSWSAGGELTAAADATGVRTDYRRDALGRVTAVERTGQPSATLELDAVGRPVGVTQNGRGVRLGYDAEGNVTWHRDALGHETRWEFDGLPTPLRRIGANRATTSYRYDGELRLAGLTNAKGEAYALDYDPLGRLERELGFDGREKRYRYGPAGWLAALDDAGRVTTYERDGVGRLTARRLADGMEERFQYDAAGRLASAANAEGEVRLVRNRVGDLLEEHADGTVLRHARDGRGRVVSTTLPDGRVAQMQYDAAGRFTALAFAGRVVTQLRRDDAGREVARRAGALTSWTDYDPQGRVTRQQARFAPDRQPVLMRDYGYDDADRMIEEGDLRTGLRAFAYDADAWLEAVDGPAPERFVTDPAGNLLASDDLTLPAVAEGDRLLLKGDRKFEYDARGNRVAERRGAGGGVQIALRYDGADRLVAREETSRLGRRLVQFSYDALGRRTRKVVQESAPAAANDGAGVSAPVCRTTRFLWSGDVLLAEATDHAEPADRLQTVYLHEPGSFRPLAQLRRPAPDAPGELYHYHLDRVGTPREVTNDAGEVVWTATLAAWGAVRSQAVNTVANPIRFQGQYCDVETGLHYNRNRFYDPDTASFISQDPIGLDGGTNLYRYVPNPTGWIDPLGLACAFVDSNGVLNLNNKFAPGSAEDAALQQHVADWNQQIAQSGGSMTRQAVTPAMRDAADTAIATARDANPAAYSPQSPGMVAGHVPDVGWGGNPAGPITPLNSSVNSYVGGATQAIPPGTTYNSVQLK